MYENSKLTERILDRPFTVKSFTYQDNMAIISVEGLKDMFIDVDEDFRIDAAGTSLGQRQKDYLGRYYYDISKKLMELSGMSSDQIEAHLKRLKTERTMNTEDFLRKFKPNYKGLIYDFSKYVEIYHISARWSDYAVYTEKVLKESWEEFYRGSNWDGQRFCHFRPEKYLGIIGKRDVVDLNEWTKFADSNIGYGLGIGSGPTYYSLKSLDEAFEEFESSLGKVEESIENMLAENFANGLKNLQKEGLFENVKSFDLDFNGRGINIKLNENTNVMPSVEELDELETKFYNLVGACEKNDYEYRSKYSNIYLVYYDDSEKYPTFDEDGHPNGGKIVEKFPIYSLDEPKEALNGKGRLAGVMCEYLAQEANPKDLFMSKLKRNNFIKKFCDKYHLTPMFYIGSRDRGDKEWDNNWLDICTDISAYFYAVDHNDDSDDSDNFEYDEGVIIGPFGEEEEYWAD